MTTPYHFICSNCGREIIPDTADGTPPKECPHCQTPIGDDYNILYRPSTQTKTYRTFAVAILIFFGLLLLLGLVVLLFHR